MPEGSDPDAVQVIGAGLSHAVVGSLSQFTILAHNEAGERWMMGGENFSVLMRGVGKVDSQPATVRVKIIDRGDGTYMCEYRAYMTGNYKTAVTLDGEHVRGSPFDTNVITLRPEATLCEVRGEALHKAIARMPLWWPESVFTHRRLDGRKSGDAGMRLPPTTGSGGSGSSSPEEAVFMAVFYRRPIFSTPGFSSTRCAAPTATTTTGSARRTDVPTF